MNELEMLRGMLKTIYDIEQERGVRLELYPDNSGAFSLEGKTLFTWGEGFKDLFNNFAGYIRLRFRQR
jgi:hypothetical protein